nr:MAG TPA: hypothetical protein [Caudoviricetes sp.]
MLSFHIFPSTIEIGCIAFLIPLNKFYDILLTKTIFSSFVYSKYLNISEEFIVIKLGSVMRPLHLMYLVLFGILEESIVIVCIYSPIASILEIYFLSSS